MKKLALAVFALFSISAFATSAFAADAPLPAILMQAKTVYIEKGPTYATKKDPSGDASYVEPCREELAKWGRFKEVSDPKQADVILRISTRQQASFMTINNRTSKSMDGATFLEVVHPATGKTLWWTRQNWGTSWSTKTSSKSVVKQLRKHYEEQQAAEGKSK